MDKEKQTCETSFGSRLRKDVEKIFDCFLILNKNQDGEASNIYKFPEDFNDKEILQQSLLFCFPFNNSKKLQHANHFTFIFTDIEGKHRFGFCKLTNGGAKCACILSFMPWFEIFYKLLNYASELSSHLEDLTSILLNLHNQEVPVPHETIQLNTTLLFRVPDPNELPSIPENRNISEYYAALNQHFMIDIFASLMFERRVIFTSSNLSTLTSCVHSAEALLRPLHWQHIFIPVMPPHLLDYVLAPMPYLVGIHSSLMPKIRSMIDNDVDVIIADVDAEIVETAHNDIENIPNDITSFLKSLLRKSNIQMGTNLAMAFLRTQARLIGGFKSGLSYHSGEEKIVFSDDKFIDSFKSTTNKEFATTLIQLQSFKQFIDGRLEMLNSGGGVRDTFEIECTLVDSAEHDQDVVKEWLSSAKKGGNELFSQFKKKAKGNMKFARQSLDAWRQQQLNAQAQQKTLEENPQRIRPSRPPPRPPALSNDQLNEARNRRPKPPRPPPPLIKKPFKRSFKPRATRRYNTLDLGDDEDLPQTPSSADSNRLRGFSNFSHVDVDLVDQMETAFDEIVNSNSSNGNHLRETSPDLLLDFSSSGSDELPPLTSPTSSERDNDDKSSRKSSLKRTSPVSKRPKNILMRKDGSFTIEDAPTPSPVFLAGPPSTPLVDLSVAKTPEKKAKVQTGSEDLIGLSFFSTNESGKPPEPTAVPASLGKTDWVTFDSPIPAAFQPIESATSEPGAGTDADLMQWGQKKASETLDLEKLYIKPALPKGITPITRTSSLPFLPSPVATHATYSTDPTGVFQANTRSSKARLANSTLGSNPFLNDRSSSVAAGRGNAFAARRPLTTQTPTRHSFSARQQKQHASRDDQAKERPNSELFSDLLTNWKSKEGL